MKSVKLFSIALFAMAMLVGPTRAFAACCEATKEAQAACKHKCCQKAAEASKVCKKCHPDEKQDK